MRLHAVVPLLGRKCTKDFTFPDTGYTIKKDMIAFIPIKGFHLDSKYYPKPEVFDPDRFSAEEKAKRHPYVFLPFGAGPRNCIGNNKLFIIELDCKLTKLSATACVTVAVRLLLLHCMDPTQVYRL